MGEWWESDGTLTEKHMDNDGRIMGISWEKYGKGMGNDAIVPFYCGFSMEYITNNGIFWGYTPRLPF